MKIPKSYSDITVQQYVELELLKQNKDIELIDRTIKKVSILTGVSVDKIEDWHPNKLFNINSDLVFINAPLTDCKLNKTFNLGLKRFRFIDSVAKFKITQQKDFNEFLSQKENNYILCLPEILSICHEELALNGYAYKPENHFKNVELFKKAKLTDVIGAVFFYSKCLNNSIKVINSYLENQNKILQEHMETMTLDSEFQTFLQNGHGSIPLVDVSKKQD